MALQIEYCRNIFQSNNIMYDLMFSHPATYILGLLFGNWIPTYPSNYVDCLHSLLRHKLVAIL